MKPHENLSVSIVIATKNRSDVILDCLKSLTFQSLLPLEVIIVDASNDWSEHTNLYRRELKQIFLVHEPSPEGLTMQRNRGVRLSQGNIILFLDDDVVLDENYISEIAAVFMHDPDNSIGGVVGEICNDPYERGWRAWKNKLWICLFMRGGQKRGGGYILPSGMPLYCSHSESIVSVEVSFGITAYRRTIFEEFLFDEHLEKYGYMDDTDFSYRVSRKYRIYHTPLAQMAHYPSPKGRISNVEMAQMRAYHHCYVFKKNMPQTLINKFCFLWSNFGLILLFLFRNTPQEWRGLFRGYKRAWLNRKIKTDNTIET